MALIRSIVCVSLVLLWSICGASSPSGTDVGAVQFDTVIRLDPPIACTHMLIFARYWVASDYYQMSIVWAEPTGPGLRFPVFPVSLAVGSDPKTFEMRHDIFSVYNTNFSKPVGPTGTFRYMYGDYPITNLRFSDSESFGERVYASDIADMDSEGGSADGSHAFRLPGRDRVVRELAGRADSDLLTSLDLFDKDHRLLKSLQYEYTGAATNAWLARETVLLPERPIELGLQGEGVTVKFQEGSQQYKDFSGIFEKGGRRCIIEYRTLTLGNKQLSLPSSLEVRDASNGTVLRSVRFSNFRLTQMDRAAARAAAADFGGLTPDLRKEDELSRRYDPARAPVLNATDLAAAKDLRDRLEALEEKDSIGRELRRLGALRRLNDTLADEHEIERLFASYLSLLQQRGLYDMVLWGGAEAVETEAKAGRFPLAKRLLNRWLDVAMQNLDIEAALRFARLGRVNSRDCETIQLLEKLETIGDSLTIASRF